MTQAGATFTVNGQTREYADIWHAKKNDSQDYTRTHGRNGNEIAQKSFDSHEIESISIKEEVNKIIRESRNALEELIRARKKQTEEQ